MSTNRLLFVYGTLKRGGENHGQLVKLQARFLGAGRIRGRLFRIQGQSYPGASPSTGDEYVRGEVYELEDLEENLKKLDEFERTYDALYARRLVDVGVKGRKMKAWIYFYQGRERGETIASGSFRVRSKRQTRRG